ncbi:hypothetical protein Daus18300_002858 [Diaporthe australafricana]|uniref:Nephrocystin 3-like N-terminal domain-containing protein n=1 Tax=Diaporthe australafricana TaxID=127596 RepID=A0ABR3XKG4_9PEZI
MKDLFKQWFQEVLAANMQTGLFRLVEETEYCRRLGYGIDQTSSSSSKTERILVSKDHLLQYLRLSDVGSVGEDIERIRRQGSNVASEGLEKARKLISMTEVNDWLSKDESKLLLVDGHSKSPGNGKTSPLSVFCASLATTLAQSESLIVLQYFCGHHSLDSDGLSAGPLGLIQSLLAQLLHQSDDILPESLDLDKELYNRVDHENIDNLCEVFGALFSQINPTKISICILDEIAEFEGDYGGWGDGMSLVAVQLREMVHTFDGLQMLKVLMTSADKSTVVSQRLQQEDKVSQ